MESPSTRIVKAYLGTSQGRIPVQVPARFSTDEQRIRTWPTQQACDRLAQQLRNGVWVPYHLVTAQQQYLQNTDPASIQLASSLNKALAELNMVRMLPPGETSDQQLRLTFVEVICYQVRLDQDNHQLLLEPLLTSYLDEHRTGE